MVESHLNKTNIFFTTIDLLFGYAFVLSFEDYDDTVLRRKQIKD
jgi:hypothetical protein